MLGYIAKLFQALWTHVWPSVREKVVSDVPTRYWLMAGLPEKAGEFSPFFGEAGTETIWSRAEDLVRFQAQMESNIDTHTILTGPSGSGKSTFLKRVVKPHYDQPNDERVIFNNSYFDFVTTFIDSIPSKPHLEGKLSDLWEKISKFKKHQDLAQRIKWLDRAGTSNFNQADIPQVYKDMNPHARDALRRELDKQLRKELDQLEINAPIELSVNQVLQDLSRRNIQKAVIDIGDEAEAFVRAALEGEPTRYFVFDQIERFLSDLTHLQSMPDQTTKTLSIYIVIRIIKTLRQLENTRTIFAIRSDFLFASIDFLTYSLDKPAEADRVFRYFYFNGINSSTSREALRQIRHQYQQINSPVDWNEFERFTSLKSKSVSNTFLIQLSGYMLENFGKTDPRVKEIVLGPVESSGASPNRHVARSHAGTPNDFLHVFFEHLIAGFHQAHKGIVNHNIFKAVALTIAVENRTSGDAIASERISRLSHIPQSYVEPVVEYLRSRNVLKQEKDSANVYVRFSHDLLFDYVVESPEFQGRDELHKGMERLAEHRIPDASLIKVSTYGNFSDELRHFDLPAVSMLVYWLFAATLSISSTLPLLPLGDEWKSWGKWSTPVCSYLYDVYKSVLDFLPLSIQKVFVVTECHSIGYYSVAIAIMHVAWLWYIYKLVRGYFQYLFVDRPILKGMAAGLVPLGTAFGMLVGFSPNLSIIPLTVVGLGMSILLEIAARQIGLSSTFGKMNHDWAFRTTMNMVFTALLLVSLEWFMVSQNPVYVDARVAMQQLLFNFNPTYLTFWLAGIFLCWFLVHISPEQQSAISMATRLTQLDVTRHQ